MLFNMSVSGEQSIFARISSRMGSADAEFRDKHTGKPAADVRPLAILALWRIGISLSDAEVTAYADAVSRGEAYRFRTA